MNSALDRDLKDHCLFKIACQKCKFCEFARCIKNKFSVAVAAAICELRLKNQFKPITLEYLEYLTYTIVPNQ